MANSTEYEGFVVALDTCKRNSSNHAEYWMARDIQATIGYTRWESFRDVIEKARMACESAGVPAENQFRQTTKMVSIGSGAERQMEDWFLSRYACYLIAMNGDPAKGEVAYAMTYFAVQTRLQEVRDRLTAEEKRLLLRNRIKDANKSLNRAAKASGVQRYAIFHDAGYKGLYGGLGRAQILAQKGIPENEDLLDCIDRAELAANEFRITQTEQKLIREQVRGEQSAIDTHYEVGCEVRTTIKKIGGTMPENLAAAESIKKLVSKKSKKLSPPLIEQS